MDIRSEVYNALAEIMYSRKATKADMDIAIEWFDLHFWDDEWEPDEDEK